MNTWYSVSLTIHLIANALWLGGIVFFLVVVGPAVHELQATIAMRTMNRARIGLEMMSWSAITLIVLSGLYNLVARAQFDAAPLGPVYIYILGAKALLFIAMAVHHGLQVFKYAPRIASLSAQIPADADAWPEPLLSLWRRWFLLLKINAALGPVTVLLGVALAKS
jgi:uncharacterized membrane protein